MENYFYEKQRKIFIFLFKDQVAPFEYITIVDKSYSVFFLLDCTDKVENRKEVCKYIYVISFEEKFIFKS